ncbi:MAG: gamma-glutamylcyclotransferase [Firmicutes bacterium]|nr:gamma-glutamylcyclotransferase [Dethiobacter sp.]MBS3889756.1 gamma-glutamylcyclotransferase [Bacillota bacterium]MBS4055367.1 gamma-glutamylcyclotransferase [Thermaerobacter sp.]
MKLRRLDSDKPDFEALEAMLLAMREMLGGRQCVAVSAEELSAFQDDDGSFKLLDSYHLPADARVDFCHVPTCIGAAILMKAYVAGERQHVSALERALKACLRGNLQGHGYEAEAGRIMALRTLIKGGLRQFLETERLVCPEFHDLVHNILHRYKAQLLCQITKGPWGEDYRADWEAVCEELRMRIRLYLAYGSNMDKAQMSERCPDAEAITPVYLEGWELTLPSFANIEPCQGKTTPGLIWEITDTDERELDRYEGYPNNYDKVNVIVNIAGRAVSVMAYVMTDYGKTRDKIPSDGYVPRILRGYREAGFAEKEFQPRHRGAQCGNC